MNLSKSLFGNILVVLLALCSAGCSKTDGRYPYFYEYGRSISLDREGMIEAYGEPDADKEWVLSLCVEGDRGNWDKVLELTAGDRKSDIGTYFRNLANASKGHLADSLLSYCQPLEKGLFIPVGNKVSSLMVAQSGEVWYRLGAMTMAERSAMLGMTFSPAKTGKKFLERLSDISLIKGDEDALAKYAGILGHNPEWTPEKLRIKKLVTTRDSIHALSDYRAELQNLLSSHPDNRMAYEYLMCFDLLTRNLAHFTVDFDPAMPHSKLYEQAALLYLSQSGHIGVEDMARFGVSRETFEAFSDYYRIFRTSANPTAELSRKYGRTYWYFYHFTRATDERK